MTAQALDRRHGNDNGPEYASWNAGTPLRMCRNPLRLLTSAGPWTAARYLAANLMIGSALFTVVVTMTVTACSLAITWIGRPVLAAAARTVRWCAQAERRRLRLVLAVPVPASYQTPAGSGIVTHGGWHDPAIRRDCVYLIALFLPLLLLDALILGVWLTLLAGVTVPLWYWAVPERFPNGQSAHGLSYGYFPHGPHGQGAIGLWVASVPSALLAAAITVAALLIFNYVLVATARVHAGIVRALLRPHTDPLAAARQLLSSPGPLA